MAERATGSGAGARARLLGPSDAAEVARFLLGRWESSIFLLSALESTGLQPGETREHGTWAGLFGNRIENGHGAPEEGPLLGVAAHLGFGTITLQCEPTLLAPLVQLVAAASGRSLGGFGGPRAQVLAARGALGLDAEPLLFDEPEQLFSLSLSALRLPLPLRAGTLACRRVPPEGLEPLVPWRAAYLAEAGLSQPGPGLEGLARDQLAFVAGQGRLFLLEEIGAPRAMCTFNAAAGGVVQIGGVFTPKDLRGLGLARAVVGGALQLARSEGKDRAVLFTGEGNAAAIKAYRALGFEAVGDYTILLFAQARAAR